MSSVKKNTEILKNAQEVDSQLYSSRREWEQIPDEKAQIDRTLDLEKARLVEIEETFKKLQLKQKEKEGELAQKEAHIKKLDGQLSQLKTNREYAAMQQEIASLKADSSLLEEEIICLLDEVDAAEEELKTDRAHLEKLEKDHQIRKNELIENEKKLKDNIEQLQKKREKVLEEVPQDVREIYNRIIEVKHGVGIVKAIGECCSACQFQFRPQVINDLRLAEQMVICENCSRILYFEEESLENQ